MADCVHGLLRLPELIKCLDIVGSGFFWLLTSVEHSYIAVLECLDIVGSGFL